MEKDPLSELRDIHLPSPDGFWPPAPGWWLLFVLAVALILILILWIRRRRKSHAWHRAARRELKLIAGRAAVNSEWFGDLNALLKQSAVVRYPDRAPASLTGAEWVDFLLETSPKDRVASRPTVEAMVASCWQPTPSCAPDDAIRFARLWLGGQK